MAPQTPNAVISSDGRWPKGVKSHPGRPPGSVVRIGPLRLLAKIQDRLMKKRVKGGEDYDPVVCLAEIATDLNNPVEVRLVAHAKVAKYIHAEMRPVEVDPSESASGEVITAKVNILDVIVGQVEKK